MKRFFSPKTTTNLILVVLAFLLADYSAANGQTAITATVPFQNSALATGTFSIFLKTSSVNAGQLTRPIIIVEGIDFFEQFPALATTELKVLNLLNEAESHKLSDRLRAEGFDVVILNWSNSGDFLQNNAFLVVRLIEEINSLKVGNEPNVLVGISMGGLVSRYALTWMEQNGRAHNVRQFISYDSPQVGANFPLSLQFWAQSFSAFNTSILNIAELAGVRSFNSESSKQMLKFHLTGVKSVNGRNVIEPIAKHTNFYNEIEGLNNNLGYPLNCQNIAISNGNKRGEGFLNSGVANAGIAFAYDFDVDGVTALTGFVRDLPTELPPTNPAALYAQHSPLGRDGFNLLPVSPEKDYDNAPGGFISWYPLIVTQMRAQGFIASVRPNQENVTFIPTHSALGLKDPNLFRSLTTWQDHELQIPFDSYYSPQQDNQFHVALPTVTANWLHLQITSPDLWNINSADASFNFGVNTNDFIFNNVTVSNGGVLGINTNRRTDFYEFNNDFLTRQPTPNALTNTWFPVQTSSKKPVTITVDNNGSLELGSEQTNGILRIKTGSVLRLKSGSNLSQRFNSRIEIKNGGSMIIEAGANINLIDNGTSIIVESGGKLTINANANINLTAQGSNITIKGGELVINGTNGTNPNFNLTGNGYFNFEAGNILTLNNDWILRGAGKTTRLVNIANNAKLSINGGRRLTVQDALIRKEATISNQDALLFNNGSTFFANNVTFDDQSSGGGAFAFVAVDEPVDLDNSRTDMDYSFRNCAFSRSDMGVFLGGEAGGRFDFRNLNVEFVNTTFTNCRLAYLAQHSWETTFDGCTILGGGMELQRNFWLQVRNTVMRGNRATTGNSNAIGIKLSGSIHNWITNRSLISDYKTGIDAFTGTDLGFINLNINGNIRLADRATIQLCETAVRQLGGTDFGLLFMDCTRVLQNTNGLVGTDLVMMAHTRNNTVNIFTRPISSPESRFFDVAFNLRQPTELSFHGTYWDNQRPTLQTSPTTETDNNAWRFRQGNNPTRLWPWTGQIFFDPIVFDGNTDLDNCGGTVLGVANVPVSTANAVVYTGGVLRDVRIQQAAALEALEEDNLQEAIDLFEPIAEIEEAVRDSANPTVKYFIDVARVMAQGDRQLTMRSKSSRWLPETLVKMPTNVEKSDVFVSPNPANDAVQLTIKNGNYHLRVSNAVGQTIFAQNTEGSLSVNVATWTNGIYLFELTDKATNKRQRSKIVVQH